MERVYTSREHHATLLVGKQQAASFGGKKSPASNDVYYIPNGHFEVKKFIQEVIGKDNQVSWKEDKDSKTMTCR